MTTLLHIDASGRASRSISRALSRRFVEGWAQARPADRVIRRDLVQAPPPFVDEAWIAAAFARPYAPGAPALAYSDAAIDELEAADLIVLGAPIYNYGMPARLKAWFDQVVRVRRTFSFDLARGDAPIRPTLSGKRLVVLSSRGEFGFAAGGVRAGMNHLDPHIATLAPYLGVAPETIRTIAAEYQEFGDARFTASLAAAEKAVDALAAELAGEPAAA